MLTRMGRENAEAVRIMAQAALAEFAQKHGLTVKIQGGSFDEVSYSPKITFTVKETADGKNVAEATFSARAAVLGIDHKYGDVKEMRGESWRLVQIELSKRKFPVICERVRDGKRYCFPVAAFTKVDRGYASQF